MTMKTLGVAAVVLAAMAYPVQAQEETAISIGAAPPGGSYYLYAGGMASLLNDKSDSLDPSVQVTRGSVENARLLDAGRLDFGFANSGVLYEQAAGTQQFEGAASDKIRGIAVVDTALLHLIAAPGSGIEAMEDLRGKRVAIGPAGSGSANTSMAVLEAAGLAEDVTIQHIGFDEGAANLRDGNVEAMSIYSAVPMPSVMDLAASRDITLVDIPESVVSELNEISPAYEAATIPGGVYQGVDSDTQAAGVPSAFVTREDVPEDVVYEILTHLYSEEGKQHMSTVHRTWTLRPGVELFSRIGVPLHPGAERFYREQGLLQ